jgi:hypothetical protein
MTRCKVRSGLGLARLALSAFALAFFLLSVVGCEKETSTAPDQGSALSEEKIYATVYVDGSIGDDAYDGRSRTVMGGGVGPKRTIQAGIDITPKRRICYVAPGTYFEQIAMADGVILVGAGAEVTIIDIDGNRGDGIRILDCNTFQTVVCGVTIRNGSCYGDNAGIRIQNSSNVLIRNNVITANLADGIRTYTASVRIVNNTIVRNGRNGIMACVGSDLDVINNIISSNCLEWEGYVAGWGLYVTSSSVINSTYNNVWLHNVNYGIGTKGICSAGTGDISIDPIFVDIDEENYHLKDGSPCIDAGIDVGFKYHNGAPDMGAFEFKK